VIRQYLENDTIKWIDIVNPTVDELNAIIHEYQLQPITIKYSLVPTHLPKFEELDNCNFIIARIYDTKAKNDAETIQEITRKIAIYFSDKFVITIHSEDIDKLDEFKHKIINTHHNIMTYEFITRLLKICIRSYEKPIIDTNATIDIFEESIFRKETIKNFLQDCYHIKRRSFTIKRILNLTEEVIQDLEDYFEDHNLPKAHIIDVKDAFNIMQTLNDETNENINNVFNIYFSLATQKNNENMALLTIFSAFFLPLTFIVGVYGMNFKNMPELQWYYGYPAIIGAMILVAVIILIWFKRKKMI